MQRVAVLCVVYGMLSCSLHVIFSHFSLCVAPLSAAMCLLGCLKNGAFCVSKKGAFVVRIHYVVFKASFGQQANTCINSFPILSCGKASTSLHALSSEAESLVVRAHHRERVTFGLHCWCVMFQSVF